ncbi:MAG TPA: hypothetical protein VKU00_11705 [Chthonomonadaceae bacterium]|nr:hypothetical protein [Chthonomonadaceae bacterium]
MTQLTYRPVSETMPLTDEEVERLATITQEISAEDQQCYRKLREKLHAMTLTESEHEELIRISDNMEGVQVKRLEYMVELAQKRNLSLPAFMEAYSLNTPPYA